MFFGKTKYIVDKSMAQHRLASTSWQDSAVHLHHKVKGLLFENGRAQSLRAGCLKEVLKRLSVCSWSSLVSASFATFSACAVLLKTEQ